MNNTAEFYQMIDEITSTSITTRGKDQFGRSIDGRIWFHDTRLIGCDTSYKLTLKTEDDEQLEIAKRVMEEDKDTLRKLSQDEEENQ